jgi:pimeloyl-ACP methyl ester carboxylesterase
MPIVQANNINIAYEVNGEGQPLLLITGLGYGAWFWHKVAPLLAKNFRVITFDNRGAGASDKPDGPYSVSLMAQDTAGLLDALKIKNAFVLGHSLGGFIAQELAITRSDLVGKLILASTTHGGMKVVPITPEALAVIMDRSGDPIDLVKRGVKIASAPGFPDKHPDVVQELVDYRLTNPVPPAQYGAQTAAGLGMNQLSDDQVAARMKAITQPALILFGEHDKVVPPANAQLFLEKLPNAKARTIPNTGHIFPIEDPQATAEVVTKFFKG